MTQDAPLDQKALEAARKAFAEIEGFQDADYWNDSLTGAIIAYLAADALVPASGGEAVKALRTAFNALTYPVASEIDPRGYSLRVERDDVRFAAETLAAALAASPIVAAPEGWRRAFLAYVEPEDAFTQLAIALCRADGHNPDATISIDGGPMQRHWHYYADEARAMLAAAPANPETEGIAAPEGWPIKLDMVTSSQFVARVQSDALTTIALPMIEELSKRPQTVWGDIVKALRSKAEELWHAPSIPEGKAEPAGQHDNLPEYDPTSPLSVAEHIYAQCEQTVLSLNGLPEHSRDALISMFGHFKKLELAALSTPVKP